jgi:hypothetical protein
MPILMSAGRGGKVGGAGTRTKKDRGAGWRGTEAKAKCGPVPLGALLGRSDCPAGGALEPGLLLTHSALCKRPWWLPVLTAGPPTAVFP